MESDATDAIPDNQRTLNGHTPLRAVSLHMLRKYLRRLRASELSTCAVVNPESVHEMRVAIRRLRTALHLLEDSTVFKRKELRALRRRLRTPARALGAVRDADVLLSRVQDYCDAHPDAAANLEMLAHAVRRQRKAARKHLSAYLNRRALARTLTRLDDLNERSPATDATAALFVRHFAGSAIWRGYERILCYETVVATAPPATLHRLRIDCKRLRYTLDFFESELGKAAQPLVRVLIKAQDTLGTLRDATVAHEFVTELIHAHPANRDLAAYAAALAADCGQLRAAFTTIWEDLSDAGFSQELAKLVAAL